MECYNCGTKLGNGEICPSCGANVKIYKKMIHLSNYYYNDGLAKANVRDLSGAIESLKNSLYYNKKNIVARNLLGLIYFEMGETVSALSEWVISKNYRQDKNAADKYLRELQKNPAQLDAINQTIKKYNQAIAYCNQGSEDLAIIQLKKVISLNSKMIRAHQLLALIYIKQEKYDQASKYLKNVTKIDANNTTTLRYQKEIHAQQKDGKKGKKEDRIAYQSGNDVIIQPTKRFKENSGISVIINILVGVAIGVAITCFLVVPSIKHNSTSDKKAELTEANNTITTKEQSIASLESQVEDLTKQVEDAKKETESASNRINSYSKVIEAYADLILQNRDGASAAMAQVNLDDLDETTRALYENTNNQISTELMATLYEEGSTAYNTYDYQTAVTDLAQVVETDPTYGEGYAIYYLAQSYRKVNDMTNAVLCYQKVVELYPGTERARTAQTYIDENPDAVAAAAASQPVDGADQPADGTDGTDQPADGTDQPADGQ